MRDIVFTHLDTDHAGGLPDFPHARAHVRAREHFVSLEPRRIPGLQQGRYRRDLIRQHEHWHLYDDTTGEPWLGIDGAQRVDVAGAELVLVPLPGHSVGHAGVAIRTDVDWLLHAGDTFMDVRQVTDPGFCLSPGLAAFEFGITADRGAAHRSIEQVRALWEQDACRIICSHDAADVPRVSNSD